MIQWETSKLWSFVHKVLYIKDFQGLTWDQGWAICSVTTLWQHRDRIRDRICDRTVIVKWQSIFFWTMTVIVLLNGPICWAIWGDITRYRAISPDIGRYHPVSGDIRAISGYIGRYRTISEDIGVISSSVKSVMYLARPIQVVPGQLIFLVNFVWPCWIRAVTILLKTADIGRYR